MKIIKPFLFLLFLVLSVIPPVQVACRFLPDPLLKGYFRPVAEPELKYFTWRRWFAGTFQDSTVQRTNEHTGLHNTLVRLRNQADYTLFGETHAPGFIRGKEGWLYEEDYIYEYTGRYFVGPRAIDRKIDRLKNVSDTLAALGIRLVVVIEPGKASYYPEHIPARYRPDRGSLSNYEYFIRRSGAAGLPVLDLNRWFTRVKDTSRYALFPRYGMHWSLYGANLAADTLSKYIGRLTGVPMPSFRPARIELSDRPRGTDYDIGDLLNLACALPAGRYAYPEVPFASMPDGKLPALIIADSYYINLVENYGKKMFGKQDYWYYNYSLYPHQNDQPPLKADKSALDSTLKQYRVVMLMVSEINLHCCFWNFADEAYRAFHPEVEDSKFDEFENTIRIDREWFRFMVRRSVEEHRPLDAMIAANASYMFNANYEAFEHRTRLDTIHHLRLSIPNNPEWMKNVERKAKLWNVPLDTAMMADAIYSYNLSKKKP
ncbi:MAG TPA: hypothetical protein PKG48_07340 [Bacteroidales bacterium]|nr:hypothetical protein [Bacteroidales bacterium]HPS63251.1 hypothetical protein [Bacteroidales bacterium]